MPGEADADRQMLRAILDYCTARSRAAPDTWPMPLQAQARQRAYEAVASAAREMLEEMDAIERG